MHRLWQTIPVLLVAALFASFALVALPTPDARAAACPELVTNGGFETTGGWQLGVTPVPPQVVTTTAHSGTHSLQLGIINGGNIQGFSSARQTVTIPSGTTPVTLSFWVYMVVEPSPGKDTMELAFLSPDGSVVLAKPMQSTQNNPAWTQVAYDLSAWQGQTIQLYFNVYNDGAGGRTGMYLDDVSLTACSSGVTPTATSTLIAPPPMATATPTVFVPTATWTPLPPPPPTWTPTAILPTAFPIPPTWTPLPLPPTWTPVAYPPPVGPTTMPPQVIPAGCTELTQNGGFEAGLAGWVAGSSTLPPTVVTSPGLSGTYATQLGSQVQNVNAYSSIRQTIAVPAGVAQTFVSFWTYTWSDVSPGVPSGDSQQFVLMGPGDAVWAVPWRVLENSQAWQQHIFEVLGVAGQTFDIYFAAVNDGATGRTALYLDEVHAWACGAPVYPATSPMQVAPEIQLQAAPQVQAVTPEIMIAPPPLAAPVTETVPALIVTPMPAEPLGAVAPAPEWTEVTIGTPVPLGQPVATLAAEASALETVVPRLQAQLGAAALLGTAAPATATPAVTISLTPRPSSFLSNITSRWPPNWPLILLAVIGAVAVVVLIIRWLTTTTSRWPFILIGVLLALLVIYLIVRSRLSP